MPQEFLLSFPILLQKLPVGFCNVGVLTRNPHSQSGRVIDPCSTQQCRGNLLGLAHPVDLGLRKAKDIDYVLYFERSVERIQLGDQVEHCPIRLKCRWFLCGESHR